MDEKAIPNYRATEDIVHKYGFHKSTSLPSTQSQTATNYGVFFTAYWPCEVLIVTERHTVAGTSAGSVTLNLVKVPSGSAIASGTSVLVSAFDLKSTANVPVNKLGSAQLSTARQLKPGDSLAAVSSGTLTSLEGVHLEVYLKPLGRGDYR